MRLAQILKSVALFSCAAVVTRIPAALAGDGHLFDQGRQMTTRSERADPALDHMKRLLGQWDVEVKTQTGEAKHMAKGLAEIHYMNRGYAYQERRHIDGIDGNGNDADVMSFLVYEPGTEQWVLGEASGYTENVELYNGAASDNGIELHTTLRRLGGTQLTHYRVRYAFSSNDAFMVLLEQSLESGGPWTALETRRYTRRNEAADFMTEDGRYGQPNSDRAEHASQFDFLIGEWTASQQLNIKGKWVTFPSNSTAVHVLGGRGILEYGWHELDPNLPDAATSILRLYNRSARRWESLYLTNRGNTLLDFGGQLEGDRIVLHSFESNRSDPIQHYVFHDIRPDRYSWYGETSTDRGQRFNRFWIIDMRRKTTDDAP